VIAAHECAPQLTRSRSDLVRACAVTDDVPKVYHRIVRWRGSKAGFQSFQVAMNVT
jgi:hypothetical protein